MAIVWFIDDMPTEARLFGRRLQSLLGSEIEVRSMPPKPKQEEYLPLLQDPDSACIIIDQRLFVSGAVSYTGISLAQYLRSVNTKIPIYILTNYNDPDVFVGGEWSVEDILGKEDLSNKNKRDILSARIRRNIDIYQDLLTKRAARFNALLKKSLKEDLSKDDIAELNELQAARTSPIVAEELRQISELEDLIQETDKLLEALSDDPESDNSNINDK